MQHSSPFAEVIGSSLIGWISQSWQWDTFPAFGSLVTIHESQRTLIGIVHQIETGSIDPTRYPFTYQKTEEELKAEQPQIFEFLKTTFSTLTLGYDEQGRIMNLLSPEPPKIHSFVAIAPNDVCQRFFATSHYLHLLFNLQSQLFNLDELLLALVREQARSNLLSQDKLHDFVTTYSLLTGNDYRRIKLFLQRVQTIF